MGGINLLLPPFKGNVGGNIIISIFLGNFVLLLPLSINTFIYYGVINKVIILIIFLYINNIL